MKALEIKINDDEPIIVASENVTFANFTFGFTIDQIVVKGSDALHFNTWVDRKPKIGDKVMIKVVETDELSPIASSKYRERTDVKRMYEQLKLELQEKGLI